jgi:predicted aspartyl protease
VTLEWLNRPLTRAFDAFLGPLGGLHPIWGVAAASVLTGVVMAWLFGKLSNQRRIRELKRVTKGHFLGMWIFRNNLRAVLASQRRVLSNSAKYALYSAQALPLLMVPVLLIAAQLQARYGWRPLAPGESTIVKLFYDQPQSLRDMADVRLNVPAGVRLETPPLRIPDTGEVDFRVAADREGLYEITAEVNGQSLAKTLQVGRSSWADALSPRRSSLLLDRLLYPVEPAIADGPFNRVDVQYHSAEIPLLGWQFHWLWPFFVLSIAAAWALKGWLRVEL